MNSGDILIMANYQNVNMLEKLVCYIEWSLDRLLKAMSSNGSSTSSRVRIGYAWGLILMPFAVPIIPLAHYFPGGGERFVRILVLMVLVMVLVFVVRALFLRNKALCVQYFETIGDHTINKFDVYVLIGVIIVWVLAVMLTVWINKMVLR